MMNWQAIPFQLHLVSTAILASVAAGPAAAQTLAALVDFDIPASELARGLERYGLQAKRQLLFSADQVAGYRGGPVIGRYDADEALRRMIGDTPVKVSTTPSGVIVLAAAGPRGASSIASNMSVGSAPAAETKPVLMAQAAPTSARTDPVALQEIVVTSQKVEENLNKAPASITALTASDLTARGIVDLQNLKGMIPALELVPSTLLFAYIRGVGTFSIAPGVDSAVSYNVDGIYTTHPYAQPPIMFDVSRVEVLRGPQGTLNGRNANGGSINVVSNKPSPQFEASGSVEAGNYKLRSTEAMVNVPLSPTMALRVAAATYQHDGYLDTGFNDADNKAARLSLLAKPVPGLSVQLTLDHARQGGKGPGVSPCPPDSDAIVNFLGQQPCAGVAWNPGHGAEQPDDNFLRARNTGAYGLVSWEQSWGTLSWIPAYRHVEFDQVFDNTIDLAIMPSIDNRFSSHELRANSPKGAALKWVAGLMTSEERSREYTRWRSIEPILSGGAPDSITNIFDIPAYHSTSRALYAQGTAPIGQGLRLTAGARYTRDQKSIQETYSAWNYVADYQHVAVDVAQRYASTTGKAAVEWDLSQSALGYLSYSTGFKAGGVNQVPPGLGIATAYEPEKIRAVQLGFKGRFLANTLQFNAELFHYDYTGFQTVGSAPLPNGTLAFIQLNSQRARFRGGEAELSWAISADDRLDFNVSALDAVFTEFVTPSTGDISGYRASNAPRATATLAYQHSFRLGNQDSLRVRAQSRWTGKYWVDVQHRPGSLQKAYTESQVDIGYVPASGGWELTAWARNLEDNGAIAGTYTILRPQANALPPRTFGLRFTKYFD
ncbi:MAG TPA: TonB-dependent receptor [Ramlibacter sp.]|nr:TonB-dependent receptor [Ramlibacter sp.]